MSKFKPERITSVRHLKQLCMNAGGDFEVRWKGKVRSKWIIRWNIEGKVFFVFQCGTITSVNVKPEKLGEILVAIRTRRLWTTEGLRADQIQKWVGPPKMFYMKPQKGVEHG